MKTGTSLLTKAATSRIICPTQACRQQHLRDDGHRGQKTRHYSSSQLHSPRRPIVQSNPALSSSRQRTFHTTSTLFATKNPYSVLGVDKDAKASDIKKAYYGLAKKFHPDTNKDPTAKDKFAEAQSAYELLTDPQKKAAYDQFGAAAFDQGGGPGPGAGDPFGGGGNPFAGGGGFGGAGFGADFNFEDLFKGFTGGGRRSRGGGRSPFEQEEVLVGDTIEVQANITFQEAAKGTSKTISYTPQVPCKPCSGSGMKAGTKRTECKACGGTGTRVHFMSGGFQMASTCGTCGGQGVTIPKGSECRSCHGNGVVRERKTTTVDIPGGIEDGMRMRLDREGDAPATGAAASPGARTQAGDLYILIRVATDPKFNRSGSDILYTASIPLTTALLGGEIKIPTLDGEVKVKVATGTGTGDKMVLGGMGMKKLQGRKGGFGDLKVEFKVQMPKYLSWQQRTIVEMLADEMGDKTAKRMMNINGNNSTAESDAESHKNEGFLKSVWHKLTDNAAHKAATETDSAPENKPKVDEDTSKDSGKEEKK